MQINENEISHGFLYTYALLTKIYILIVSVLLFFLSENVVKALVDACNIL